MGQRTVSGRPPTYLATTEDPVLNNAIAAQRTFEGLAKICSTVQLLPWRDRALWVLHYEKVLHYDLKSTGELYRTTRRRRPTEYLGEKYDEASTDYREAADLYVDLRARILPPTGDSGRFESYLQHKANPTTVSRFLMPAMTYRILRSRVFPWSRKIALKNVSTPAILGRFGVDLSSESSSANLSSP